MPRKPTQAPRQPTPGDALEVRRLNDMAASALGTNAERALRLAVQARELAVILDDREGISESDYQAGRAHWILADFDAALECLSRARHGFRDLGNTARQAAALRLLGVVQQTLGNIQLSLEYLQEALELARSSNERILESDILNNLGGTYFLTSQYAAAIDHLAQALNVFSELRDFEGMVPALSNLGLVYTNLGDFPKALELLLQAYRIVKHELHDPKLLSDCLVNVGNLHQSIHNHRASQKYLRESLEVSRAAGDRVNEVYSLVYLGLAELHLGQPNKALGLLREARTLAEAAQFQQGQVEALTALGRTFEHLKDQAQALEAYGRALEIARQTEDVQGQVTALSGIGSAHLLHDEFQQALEALTQALAQAEHSELARHVCETHLKISDAHRRAGHFEAALTHYQRHHQLERRLYSERHEQRAQVLEAQFALETERSARNRAEALVAERTQELEAAQVEIVNRLALAGEYRDDRTGTHTWRVGWIAGLIAREFGWDEHEISLIRMAARLHDIGKIGVPDALLSKKGPLSDAEFLEMEHHTLIGSSILSGGQSAVLHLAEEIALTHHEHWDGSGYPNGLSGEDIPLSGRIVAVADVFDALTHTRSYKRAWKLPEALKELHTQAGKQFDPKVIEVALQILTPANLRHMEAELSRGDVPVNDLAANLPRLRVLSHRLRTATQDDDQGPWARRDRVEAQEFKLGPLGTYWVQRSERRKGQS